MEAVLGGITERWAGRRRKILEATASDESGVAHARAGTTSSATSSRVSAKGSASFCTVASRRHVRRADAARRRPGSSTPRSRFSTPTRAPRPGASCRSTTSPRRCRSARCDAWCTVRSSTTRRACRARCPPPSSRERGLVDLASALVTVHQPDADADVAALNAAVSPGHRAIVYDELFYLQLGMALKKSTLAREAGIAFTVPAARARRLGETLPFQLTGAQRRVIAEIERDMATPHPMHRLVQGDVGSGKTVVALHAAAVAIESGYQAALMAPDRAARRAALRDDPGPGGADRSARRAPDRRRTRQAARPHASARSRAATSTSWSARTRSSRRASRFAARPRRHRRAASLRRDAARRR